MDFIFSLGFSEELAHMELETVLGQKSEKVGDHQYKVNFPRGFSQMNYLSNRLGGLVEVHDTAGKLVWRHSAKEWYKRDRLKPYSDPHKGLLPPKIARILVNLALGTSDPEGKTLFDPFCGSGTILLEAGLMKLKTVGNDLDPDQLSGARRNLNFLDLSANLMNYDATKLSDHLNQPVDFIATEPFMGRPGARVDRLPDLARGLGKLYLGCLKDWNKFLKTGARICMVFPIFEYAGREYKTSPIIDDKQLIDYNILTRGLTYSRPEAKVIREIIILEKK